MGGPEVPQVDFRIGEEEDESLLGFDQEEAMSDLDALIATGGGDRGEPGVEWRDMVGS